MHAVRHTRTLKPAGIALAAVVLLGHGAQLAHLVLVSHGTCAEHGEAVHAEVPYARGVPFAGDRLAASEASTEDSHHHEHCTLLSHRRHESEGVASQRVTPAPIVSPIATAAADTHVGSRLAAYRLAPKQSPPV